MGHIHFTMLVKRWCRCHLTREEWLIASVMTAERYTFSMWLRTPSMVHFLLSSMATHASSRDAFRNDAIFLFTAVYTTNDVFMQWKSFDKCSHPLQVWLFISYISVVLNRCSHFLGRPFISVCWSRRLIPYRKFVPMRSMVPHQCISSQGSKRQRCSFHLTDPSILNVGQYLSEESLIVTGDSPDEFLLHTEIHGPPRWLSMLSLGILFPFFIFWTAVGTVWFTDVVDTTPFCVRGTGKDILL